MHKMFSESADFSGILNSGDNLSISQVFHKAFINVDEEGAEAAAATGNILSFRRHLVEMILMVRFIADLDMVNDSDRISMRKTQYFQADHPFFFALISPTDTIFMGRYIGK